MIRPARPTLAEVPLADLSFAWPRFSPWASRSRRAPTRGTTPLSPAEYHRL